MFPGCLKNGLIGKANIPIEIIDLTKYKIQKNQYSYLDRKPFGENTGMIICAEVIENAIKHIPVGKKIYPSPKGKVFTQSISEQLKNEEHLIFLCGRYEGIDQRAIDFFEFEEISLGDFILCGGEVAAMAMCECIIRLQDKTLSNPNSLVEESFSNGLLEHNHYTKPRQWKNISVPDVLLNGNHAKIQDWQLHSSLTNTYKTRPELLYKMQIQSIMVSVLLFFTTNILKKIHYKYKKEI